MAIYNYIGCFDDEKSIKDLKNESADNKVHYMLEHKEKFNSAKQIDEESNINTDEEDLSAEYQFTSNRKYIVRFPSHLPKEGFEGVYIDFYEIENEQSSIIYEVNTIDTFHNESNNVFFFNKDMAITYFNRQKENVMNLMNDSAKEWKCKCKVSEYNENTYCINLDCFDKGIEVTLTSHKVL